MSGTPFILVAPGWPGLVGVSGGWTPSRLFGPSDTGDWWDVSKSARIWTTSGATVNAGDGAVVGRLDGLKNGNNLIQGTTSAKPIRHLSGGLWYITTDGVNDRLNASFTLNQPATRISAVMQVAWTLSGRYIYDGGSSASSSALYQYNVSPQVRMTAGSLGPIATTLTVGAAAVVTEIWNGASSKIAINNAAYTTGAVGAANAGGLTIGTDPTGANPTNLQFYGMINIGRVLSDAEIAKCRAYFGRLCGVSL